MRVSSEDVNVWGRGGGGVFYRENLRNVDCLGLCISRVFMVENENTEQFKEEVSCHRLIF